MYVTVSCRSGCELSGAFFAIRADKAGPGMALFTSGTIRRPKGVVLPRICFAELRCVEQGKVVLNHLLGHWKGRARNLIEPVVTGGILVRIGRKRLNTALGLSCML